MVRTVFIAVAILLVLLLTPKIFFSENSTSEDKSFRSIESDKSYETANLPTTPKIKNNQSNSSNIDSLSSDHQTTSHSSTQDLDKQFGENLENPSRGIFRISTDEGDLYLYRDDFESDVQFKTILNALRTGLLAEDQIENAKNYLSLYHVNQELEITEELAEW